MSDGRILWLASGAFVVLALYAFFFGPPQNYPVGALITIPSGMTVAEAGNLLENQHAIRMPLVFYAIVRLEGRGVFAGTYLLPAKQNVFTLAYRLSHGITDVTQLKVTFPEGSTVVQMAKLLKSTFPAFDDKKFISLAKPDEGYLFPDTYFFTPDVTPEAVVERLKETFQMKIAPLEERIHAFGKSESAVIIMASILEKEGRQPDTRRTIAGILWKRLSIGMPLQIDVAFAYIFNQDTYEPTLDDLKLKSPYNTYVHAGLPPGPIGNPGLETIQDAITPISTPYLYYVTDKEGNIYYAKTFAEHVDNKKKANN